MPFATAHLRELSPYCANARHLIVKNPMAHRWPMRGPSIAKLQFLRGFIEHWSVAQPNALVLVLGLDAPSHLTIAIAGKR
jgi:hypothetical protein